MDALSVLLGAGAAAFAILLGLLTIGGTIRRWFKEVTLEVLLETGIIRYLRTDEPSLQWPNGWQNLPDALEGMGQKIDRHFEWHEADAEAREYREVT